MIKLSKLHILSSLKYFLLIPFVYLVTSILKFPNAVNIIIVLIIVIAIAGFSGMRGFLFLALLLIPFDLPAFNVSKLPMIGTVLLSLPLKERLITLYSLALLPFFAGKLNHFKYLKKPSFFIFLILFFGLLSTSVFADISSLGNYIFFTKNLLYPCALFFLVCRYATNITSIKRMLLTLFIGNFIFTLLTYLFSTNILAYIGSQEGTTRFGGYFSFPFGITTYAGPVLLSGYLSFTLLLATGLFLISSKLSYRIFFACSFFITLYKLFFTFSRTGIYGILIIVLLISVYYSKSNQLAKQRLQAKRIFKTFFILLLFVAILFLFYQQLVSSISNTSFSDNLDRLSSPTAGGSNIYGRWFIFSTSIANSLANPFGEGVFLLNQQIGVNHHASFTKYLAALGWFGMFSFISLIYFCLKTAWRSYQSNIKELRDIALLLWFSIIQLVFMSFGIGLFGYLWGVSLLWTTLALAVSLEPIRLHAVQANEIY